MTRGDQKGDALMGGYLIRTYEDKDYEAARAIFADGIRALAPEGARHALSCPQTYLLLLGVFLLAYVASASLLLSLGSASALLALGWRHNNALWFNYVRDALQKDMRDIRGTYLEHRDCHFWVAASGEEVVGTVAVAHPEEPWLRGRALELKRMSVKKEHRGRGVSKALTRAVLRFAQEHGYPEVMLGTSMVQHVAQRLYERMGFRRVQALYPSLLCRLMQFYVCIYSYEIPEPR